MKGLILIGVHGRAGSGKDTIADYLCDRYGFSRYAFADPLRDGLKAMLGLTDADFTHRARKEAAHPVYGVSPRHMLQTLGTEWGRKLIHPEVWLKRATGWLEYEKFERDARAQETFGEYPALKVVVSDVRFENEVQWIRDNGGTVWHVVRHGTNRVQEHESENAASYNIVDNDIIVANDKTTASLYDGIDRHMRVVYEMEMAR